MGRIKKDYHELDELIARAPLTWPDFRQLALQSQEALIAAQDHDIVHRDLKVCLVGLVWVFCCLVGWLVCDLIPFGDLSTVVCHHVQVS